MLQAKVQELGNSTLLLVDDEPDILSSLNRLFRVDGYRVITTTSGMEGLAILEQEDVDVIISDMRMPEMDGAEFFARVARRWPEIVRILLTGYSDIESAIRSVNEGGIYKYVSKPWDTEDIRITVRHALERKHLQGERDRLYALTVKQNSDLKYLNENLEKKVIERTEELKVAHETLKKSYFSSIKTFSNLIELREGSMFIHSKRVAAHARKVAQKLGLDDEQTQQVFFAALLHDIGKIGLPDELIKKPYDLLGPADRIEVAKHTILGDALLMGFSPLQEAAKIIRSHHEYLDGSGYPDKISGDEIPVGAKILAVVNDYDALMSGELLNKKLTHKDASKYIMANRGRLYDPQVVDAFIDSHESEKKAPAAVAKVLVDEDDLKPGMVLAKDLITKAGVLVLSEGYVLDEELIRNIRGFIRSFGERLDIYVTSKEGV